MTVGFARDNTDGAAAALARASDVAIVIVGNHPTCDAGWAKCPVASDGKEAVDRTSIDLEQEALVKEVVAANPRTVLVLKASFPYAITWSQAHVPAILTMAHNSQEEGSALADVLFGDYNPAGRTVHTWPRSIDQLPPMMDYDITHGRTYMYFKGEPLYPFGFGLSYTTFEYAGAALSSATLAADPAASVDLVLDLKNTGARAGDEVVQVYATWPASRVSRPRKQLVAFSRVPVPAGATRRVRVPIEARRLTYWDGKTHAFVVEPGTGSPARRPVVGRRAPDGADHRGRDRAVNEGMADEGTRTRARDDPARPVTILNVTDGFVVGPPSDARVPGLPTNVSQPR